MAPITAKECADAQNRRVVFGRITDEVPTDEVPTDDDDEEEDVVHVGSTTTRREEQQRKFGSLSVTPPTRRLVLLKRPNIPRGRSPKSDVPSSSGNEQEHPGGMAGASCCAALPSTSSPAICYYESSGAIANHSRSSQAESETLGSLIVRPSALPASDSIGLSELTTAENSSAISSTPSLTLEQREQAYEEARRRIFGSPSLESQSNAVTVVDVPPLVIPVTIGNPRPLRPRPYSYCPPASSSGVLPPSSSAVSSASSGLMPWGYFPSVDTSGDGLRTPWYQPVSGGGSSGPYVSNPPPSYLQQSLRPVDAQAQLANSSSYNGSTDIYGSSSCVSNEFTHHPSNSPFMPRLPYPQHLLPPATSAAHQPPPPPPHSHYPLLTSPPFASSSMAPFYPLTPHCCPMTAVDGPEGCMPSTCHSSSEYRGGTATTNRSKQPLPFLPVSATSSLLQWKDGTVLEHRQSSSYDFTNDSSRLVLQENHDPDGGVSMMGSGSSVTAAGVQRHSVPRRHLPGPSSSDLSPPSMYNPQAPPLFFQSNNFRFSNVEPQRNAFADVVPMGHPQLRTLMDPRNQPRQPVSTEAEAGVRNINYLSLQSYDSEFPPLG